MSAAVMMLVTVGIAVAPALPAAAASTEDDARQTTWTVQSATDGEPDSRVSIRHELDAGSHVDDAVVVTNFGPSAATFRVYASDGVVGAGGAFDLLPPGQEPTDGGSWVFLEEVAGAREQADGALRVDLGPEESIAIPMRIEVPDGATPGDHPAGVVAELTPESGQEVEVTSRVGVRLHLRVAGEIEAQLTTEDVEARWVPTWNPFSPGQVRVSYVLHNTGNIRLGAGVGTELNGPFGVAGTRASQELREILPGERVHLETDLVLWGLVRAQLGIAVEPHSVGEDAVDVELVGSHTTHGVWTAPWAQLVLVLMLAAAIFVWRRRRRTAARRVQERIDAAVADATARSRQP